MTTIKLFFWQTSCVYSIESIQKNLKGIVENIRSYKRYLIINVLLPSFLLFSLYASLDNILQNHSINKDYDKVHNSQYNFQSSKLTIYQKAMDVNNPVTRKYALQLAKNNPGSYNFKQVFSIYDDLINNWNYVNDPISMDLVSKASFSIDVGLTGDCDDYAITMASLIECIGGRTRIISATNGNSGHAYAEVHVGNQKKKQELIQFLNKRYGRFYKNKIAVHFSLDDVGDYWLNLDWTAKHPGGKYYKSDHETIYYPTQNYYVMTK